VCVLTGATGPIGDSGTPGVKGVRGVVRTGLFEIIIFCIVKFAVVGVSWFQRRMCWKLRQTVWHTVLFVQSLHTLINWFASTQL